MGLKQYGLCQTAPIAVLIPVIDVSKPLFYTQRFLFWITILSDRYSASLSNNKKVLFAW